MPPKQVEQSLGDLLSAIKKTAVGLLNQGETSLPPSLANTVKNMLKDDAMASIKVTDYLSLNHHMERLDYNYVFHIPRQTAVAHM